MSDEERLRKLSKKYFDGRSPNELTESELAELPEDAHKAAYMLRDPLAEVKRAMAEVGWTNTDMKAFLKKHYGGRTSRELTEPELADLPEAIKAATAATTSQKPTEDGW
jgi:hypothetical protein